MADQVVYEQSLESQIVDEPFVSRQSVYVIDSNNGAYNGQIQIDTSSLSNSGRWVSYSEGVLHIPLVVAMEALSATSAQTSTNPAIVSGQVPDVRQLRKQFAVGLKNGYFQLIHSLAVEYNNTNVVQLTPYLNHFVTYKLLTTLSQADIDKWGTSIGFFPDSWQSHDYDAGTTANSAGKGSINNRNLSFAAYNGLDSTGLNAKDYNQSNEGFRKRTINCTNQQPYSFTTSTILNEDNVKSLARNYYKSASEQGTNVDVFYVMAQIRLKDVCDFFDKLPLTRGAYLRLLINTNTAEHKISYVVTDTGASFTVNQINNSSTTITGGSSPLMIASGEDNTTQQQGGAFWAYTGSIASPVGTVLSASTKYEFQFSVRTSIVKDSSSGLSHPIPNCRLYVPLYTMTNEEVSRYLSLQPTKHIVYRDIFQYQVDIGAGATFNNLLTNGIANPKSLLCIPYIQATSNPTALTGTNVGGSGASATSNTIAPWQSPFASEPGTTSPYVGLTDYNVQLAGVNLYTSNFQYDFEAFRNELARINGINGGVVDGLMSGLIGQQEFQANMRYYVTDLSRRIKAEDAVPKSIQISGKNASQVPITLFVFVEYEKSVDVALDSGLLLG